jgi:hypothetical protein
MSTNTSTQVKLQVNDSGSWRNVIHFEYGDLAQALEASTMLAEITTGATFRVALCDSISTALMRWSKEKGWVNV